MRKCFENTGITMPQAMVMGALFDSGEMKVTELSKKLGLTNSTVSGIIDRLEKQQLIERIRNTEDKRVVMIKISDKFRDKHENHMKIAEVEIEKLFRKASIEEIDKIIDGLDVLKKIIGDEKE